MIVDAPWYIPITVIRRDLHAPIIKEEICHYSNQYSAPQCTPKRPRSEAHGATWQQAIAKTSAKRSAYDSKFNILICSLVFKV
jgi:hypothetical protein